jgi:methionyl-tRNA formyltransferase
MGVAPHAALTLGGPGPLTALVLHAWLDQGHVVAAFLHAEAEATWRQDRLLAMLRPRLSVTAALRRAGIVAEAVPQAGSTAAILGALDRTGATLLLSAGYRRRVLAPVLARLPERAVNIHPALLPAYRGPAPSLALLRDDAFGTAGGATLHLMDAAFDTGPIIARRGLAAPVPRDALGYRIASGVAAAALVTEALPAFLDGRRAAWPQLPCSEPLAKVSAADFTLGAEWDRARIERMAEVLCWSDRLMLPGAEGPVAVIGRPVFLPADAPPAPRGWVQAPWDGGVVRFRRWRGMPKRLWRVRRLLRTLTQPIPQPGPEVPP